MLGENEKNILLLWDAPVKGQRIFYSVWECLEKQHIPINHILYLYCEANYKNDAFRDRGNKQANTGGLNTKERVAALEQYFSGSTVVFEPLMLSERELPIESVDEIPVVQKAIERHVFPQLIKHNPKSLHVTLASGTTEMVFAWISLYTSATFTRTFGDSVTLWRFSDNTVKTDSGKTKYSTLYKLDMPINPYIGIAAQEAFDFTETSTIDMDGNGQIKRNSVLNAPLLLLGERGIGKSTVVETTVYAEKENRGLVQDTDKGEKNIQIVVCGLFDSALADDELFGHAKGAYTGADKEKTGAIERADGGLLFLDEIQDLPRPTQRKLLRVLQTHKFKRLGDEKERESHFQLVCASNRTLKELRQKLDADFFDRIAVFTARIPALRELPEGSLEELWRNRWDDCRKRRGYTLPQEPDSFALVKDTLIRSGMKGNIRDVEQLIGYIARDVYCGSTTPISENAKKERYEAVIAIWEAAYNEKYPVENPVHNTESNATADGEAVTTTISKEMLEQHGWDGLKAHFLKWLSAEAEKAFGSQTAAAKAMKCTTKTLRNARGGD